SRKATHGLQILSGNVQSHEHTLKYFPFALGLLKHGSGWGFYRHALSGADKLFQAMGFHPSGKFFIAHFHFVVGPRHSHWQSFGFLFAGWHNTGQESVLSSQGDVKKVCLNDLRNSSPRSKPGSPGTSARAPLTGY